MKTTIANETVYFGTGSGQAEAEAPSIVFVHGAGFDHSVWVMPARYFARHGFQVVAPDLPGHGRSAGAPLETIESMADWLTELIRVLCGGKATLVGHSMGSLAVLDCASRHGEVVDAIALLGTSAPMPVGPPLLDAARDGDHAAIDMANTWSHSSAGSLGMAGNPGMSNLYSGERWLERCSSAAYYADLAACNAYSGEFDVERTPSLIIAGTADRMTPARQGGRVADALDNAATVLLPGCGHSMLSEQPNQVLDALAEFIMRR